jgi:two-component system cell cycle response regulator
VRSIDRTRHLPIVVMIEPGDEARLMRGLDMGVNDYLIRPLDRQEFLARVNTQVRRWRFTERLRDSVQQSLEMAVTDPLTGLYNRRYMSVHVGTMVDTAADRGKTVSVLALDVDHFKSVNDGFGHDGGDEVLKELARRIKANIRDIDLACRTGGEEFVIALPETGVEVAYKVAERLRRAIGGKPFNVGPDAGNLTVTVSIGVAELENAAESLDDIVKRADEALYRAKREGRNRVIAEAA